MKAEITMNQLWWNHSIRNFFFRSQAWNAVEELMGMVEYSEKTYNAVFDAIDEYFDDLDDCEETFYSEPLDDIIENIGLGSYIPNYEDDEDDEDESRLTDEEEDLYHHGFHD